MPTTFTKSLEKLRKNWYNIYVDIKGVIIVTQERENKMDKIKKYAMYFVLVIAFFILSDFLIYVGLNSSYRDIQRQDSVEEVSIYQAEATKVNGRIRGLIQNPNGEDLNGKFVEVDLYSKRDVFLGRKYIQINNLQQGDTQSFELLFKMEDVSSYNVSIVDEKQEGEEIDLLPKDLTTSQIVVATVLTFLIFW